MIQNGGSRVMMNAIEDDEQSNSSSSCSESLIVAGADDQPQRFGINLNNAIKQGNVKLVNDLLSMKFNNSLRDETTNSESFKSNLQLLLTNRKINYTTLGQCSILHVAVMRQDLEMINYLTEDNIYIHDSIIRKMLLIKTSRNNDSILHTACNTGNYQIIQCILTLLKDEYHILKFKQQQQHESVTTTAVTGTTTTTGGEPLLKNEKELQKRSISSEYLSYYYDKVSDKVSTWTGEISKVIPSSPEKVSFLSLFKKKEAAPEKIETMMINIDELNDDKYTPLFCAILSKSSQETVQTLVDLGSDVHLQSASNENIFHISVKSNSIELVQHVLLLVDESKMVEMLLHSDKEGRTPFHLCAHIGNVDICKILIDQYKSLEILDKVLNKRDCKGRVAYQIAREEHSGGESNNPKDICKLIHQHMPTMLLLQVDERMKQSAEREKLVVKEMSNNGLDGMNITDSLKWLEKNSVVVDDWELVDHPNKQKQQQQLALSHDVLISVPQKFKESTTNSTTTKIKSEKVVKLTSHDQEQESIFDYVRQQGYPIEKHETVTSDGYVLQIHRIPHGNLQSLTLFKDEILLEDELERRKNKKRPVVFLQHGVFNSSSAWLIGGQQYSFAFMLADAGFDVWLGNNRGVQFSRKHISWNSFTDKEFWKFSFTEMAKFDFPAQIKYVLKYTQVEKLSYVGHSQGTTQAFVALTLFPELQKKLEIFIALAPVCSLKHQTSKLLSMVTKMNTDILFSTLEGFGIGEIGATQISRSLLPKLTQSLFNEAWTVLSDCDIDHAILPILSRYEPSPTSLQNLIHWGQLIKSESFQSFTFPAAANSSSSSSGKKSSGLDAPLSPPPLPKVEKYDLNKIIDVPVAVFYGTLDYLANPTDVEEFLMEGLKYSLIYSKKIHGFKHNDFVWGKRARDEVYVYALHLLTQKVFKDGTSLTEQEQQDLQSHTLTPKSAVSELPFSTSPTELHIPPVTKSDDAIYYSPEK